MKDQTQFRLALITGASSGIGQELATLLGSKGISLILTGRNETKLNEIGKKVNAQQLVIADLNQKQQRNTLVALIREKVPDLVINCAGFGFYGDVLTIDVQEQLEILEVDAKAPLELTLEAARTLVKANKRGVVMNVSSVAGEHPCPGMSVYGGAKSFLTMTSRALNEELKSYGVYVLVNCPGMVATDFATRAARKKLEITKGPVLSAQFVAHEILKQIEKKQEKRIINWQYRLASTLATYCAPVKLVKKMVWKQIKKRI